MIPILTMDEDFILKHPDPEEMSSYARRYCSTIFIGDKIPVYPCGVHWVDVGLFKEYKQSNSVSEAISGYCDTEESFAKLLQKYVDDKENNYFVNVGFMDMDREKYYKVGSYYNKEGIDTELDYYDYISKHPEMKVKQSYENKWITFMIHRLSKN